MSTSLQNFHCCVRRVFHGKRIGSLIYLYKLVGHIRCKSSILRLILRAEVWTANCFSGLVGQSLGSLHEQISLSRGGCKSCNKDLTPCWALPKSCHNVIFTLNLIKYITSFANLYNENSSQIWYSYILVTALESFLWDLHVWAYERENSLKPIFSFIFLKCFL